MERNHSSDCQPMETLSSPETTPLLVSSESSKLAFKERLVQANVLPRGLCLPSKAAVLILFWTLVVSTIYTIAQEGTVIIVIRLREIEHTAIHSFSKHNFDPLITYLAFVVISLLYPLAGFLADVCYGRYKTVIASLCLLLCGFACIGLNIILVFSRVVKSPFNRIEKRKNPALFHALTGSGLLLIIMGLSGFRANYTQLGLDQLMEANSDYLGLFIHWLEWMIMLGSLLVTPLFLALGNCDHSKKIQYAVLSLGPSLFLTLLLVIVFSCWKRHWFYIEPGQNNPYKTVFKVLNFARKHKYPLQCSAFTYADDEEPSRLDFAKERYGGPFTTEQVEDVKTFFKILAILLVLGPVFFLEIPGKAILY